MSGHAWFLNMLQQGLLATYLSPVCCGRAVELESEAEGPPGPAEGPTRLKAQARPKPGPGQISGNLEICNLEICEFGIKQIQKIQSLKIQICSAQNVGKVQISRETNTSGPIWVHFRQMFPWAGQMQKILEFCIFSLVGQ